MKWHALGMRRYPISPLCLTYGCSLSGIGKLQRVQYHNASDCRRFRALDIHGFSVLPMWYGAAVMCKFSGLHLGNVARLDLASKWTPRLCESKDVAPPSMNASFHPIFFQRIAPAVAGRPGLETNVQGNIHA